MKNVLIFLLLLVFLSIHNAFASVITFEDINLGDYGDSISIDDIVIQTYQGGHLQVTDQSADGFGNAHSMNNKLSVWADEPRDIKEKTSFLINFSHPINIVSFWLTGTFHDTTVNAYDLNNNLIDSFTQTYPMLEPLAPDGQHWDYYYDRVLRFVELEENGISSISIQPTAYDGFSIDDLSYNTNPIPEPSSLLLLGAGLCFWHHKNESNGSVRVRYF